MYSTEGIDSVASVTELRSRTTEIVDHARRARKGVLIQRNSEPLAVLISYEWYRELLARVAEQESEARPR